MINLSYAALDVSQITGMPVRDVREMVNRHAARVLEPLGNGTRFQFAHQALLDTCLEILDADQETEIRLQRVSRWAGSWREREWPPDSTPRYLLSEYPFALVAARDYAAAGEVVSDPAWVVACIASGGVGVAQSALASAAPAGLAVDAMRRIVDCETPHLSPRHPVAQPSYVARQLGLAALRVATSSTVRTRLNDYIEHHGGPRLTATWTTRPLEPALVRVLGRARGNVSAVAVTPDGQTAFAADDCDVISAWDVRGADEPWIIGQHDGVWSLAVSPNGRYIASAARDTVINYQLDSTANPVEVDEYADALALSHNGRRMYASAEVSDRGIWGWDLDKHAPSQPLPSWRDKDAASALALALTEDDGHLVAVNHSGDVVTWRLAGAKTPGIVRHRLGGATAAALTPDARLAVVVDSDGYIYVCRPLERSRPKEVARIDAGVLAIAADPAGRHAVLVASDGTVRALDLARTDSLRVLGRHDEYSETAIGIAPQTPATTEDPDAPQTTDEEWYTGGVAITDGIAVTAGRDRFLRVWSLAVMDRPSLEDPFVDSLTCLCLSGPRRKSFGGYAARAGAAGWWSQSGGCWRFGSFCWEALRMSRNVTVGCAR